MYVEHELEIVCKCPVNGLTDIYAAVVRCNRVVQVEDILEAVEHATKEACFQEHHTEALSRKLGCQVETTGRHSGVKTRCVCGEL